MQIFMPLIIGLGIPMAQAFLLLVLLSKWGHPKIISKLAGWGTIAIWFFVWLRGYNTVWDGWDYSLFESISHFFLSITFFFPWIVTSGLETIFSLETGALGGFMDNP